MTSNPVVIVDAVRTPIGRFCGSLAPVRADHLGAVVLNALMERNGLSPDVVGDVVFACVTPFPRRSAILPGTFDLVRHGPDTTPALRHKLKSVARELDLPSRCEKRLGS